jgi:hypothetical protein
MNAQISGSVRMAGDTGRGVGVNIHLEDETLTLVAAGGNEIGTWPLEQVGIASKPDGFHLRIEGEEVVLTTDDDARFALALGISAPTSRLARRMAKLRDETAAASSVMVDLTDSAPVPSPPPLEAEPPMPSRRESRLANGLPYLGPLVVATAVVALIASLVAATGGRAISFPGDIPAWPAMIASSLILAAGGFSAFQSPGKGRASIGIGIAVGLLVILLTAGRLSDEGMVGQALLGFTLAVVGAGVLLAIDTAGRDEFD